ncbi:MAG: SoxR reducing system RseC family protein [Candidatus Delongbacteria bacterium]
MDTGTVKSSENGYVYIEMELNSSCKSCSNRGVCMAGDEPARIKVENKAGLKPGDIVEIDLAPKTKLAAGFLLFMIPLITLFVFYYTAFLIWETEEAGMAGAVIGFFASITGLILFSRSASQKKFFKPRSVRKISQ